MVKKKDPSPKQQDNKTGFYSSGMKTTTPGRHNKTLVKTKEMEATQEEPNTIKYNEPTTPFQMLR